MAKVSKVNVSITGDSKGLTKATDEAAANMRRLRAEKEQTAKKLGQFKQETNQVAESIAKLGFAPRGLQAIGALGFMGSLGTAGLRYAALGGIAADIAQFAWYACHRFPIPRKHKIRYFPGIYKFIVTFPFRLA